MFKKMILTAVLISMFSVLALAEGYSIKTMTPEVQQALSARRDRFSDLRSLKASGTIGENNRGYVEALKGEGSTQAIVEAENHDRQVIYKTIAQQNNLEGALSTIEKAFAQVQKDKAETGDKVQTEDGSWITR